MRKSIVALIALFAGVVLVLWSTMGARPSSSAGSGRAEPEARPTATTLERVQLESGPEQEQQAPVATVSAARQPIEHPQASAPAPRPASVLHVRVVAEGSGKALADVNTYVWKDEPPRAIDALADPEQADVKDWLSALAEGAETDGLGDVIATGTDGKASLRVPCAVPLVLHAEGGDAEVGSAEVKVPPLANGEQREILVHLSVGGVHYCGRVVDRVARTPIEGAVVLVRDWMDKKILATALSDAAGAFELEVSKRGELDVCIEADGFGLAYAKIDKRHPSPKRAQLFALTRSASITGRVLDADGGAKSDIKVRAATTRDALRQPFPESFGVPDDADPEWTTRTDESGRYRLSDLPARVSLQLGLKNEETPRIEHLALAPGEERELDIVLVRDVTLSGLVVDQNERPVADLEIEITPGELGPPVLFFTERDSEASSIVTTDSAGRFRQALRPGRWFVGRAAGTGAMMGRLPDGDLPEAERIATYGQLIELQREPLEQEAIVHVARGLYIRGRVVDADGAPVEEALLGCRQRACGGPFNVKAAKDGTFVLGPLIQGEYQVAVQGQSGEPVSARAGDTDVVLHVKRPPTGSIRVRVTANGRPAPRAEVALLSSEFSASPGPPVNGEYTFEGLEPGTYDLIATTESLLGFAGGLSPASGDVVVVEMHPSTTIRVTYLGDEPELTLTALQGTTRVAAGTAHAGTSSVLQVPPGPLSIELAAWHPFESTRAPPLARREVSALLGQEIEVEIR